MCIHFYGKIYSAGGGNPDCIFVWKVPPVHTSQHAVKVAITIDMCRGMAPTQMSQEAVRHYNNIMDHVSIDIPAGAKVALRNYIFCGDPTPDECIADEYVKFVQDMAEGQASLYNLHMFVCFSLCSTYQYVLTPTLLRHHSQQPINASLLADGRLNNSRGGTGIGSTQYDEFWDACRAVLLPDSAADERRNSDTVYASRAHSIPNLVKLATDILQQKVDTK